MRRQILTVVSIAVISFLIGTTLNMSLIVMGNGDGSPWDKVWTAISDLQNRVNAIEEETNQVKTIRFYDPSEYTLTQYGYEWTTVKTFTWIPNNSTNNAILNVAYYAEYKALDTLGYDTLIPMWRIIANDHDRSYGHRVTLYENVTDYVWTPLYGWTFSEEREAIEPNQASYTIKFQIAVQHSTVYFRNINIIITVADGLRAEN